MCHAWRRRALFTAADVAAGIAIDVMQHLQRDARQRTPEGVSRTVLQWQPAMDRLASERDGKPLLFRRDVRQGQRKPERLTVAVPAFRRGAETDAHQLLKASRTIAPRQELGDRADGIRWGKRQFHSRIHSANLLMNY